MRAGILAENGTSLNTSIVCDSALTESRVLLLMGLEAGGFAVIMRANPHLRIVLKVPGRYFQHNWAKAGVNAPGPSKK